MSDHSDHEAACRWLAPSRLLASGVGNRQLIIGQKWFFDQVLGESDIWPKCEIVFNTPTNGRAPRQEPASNHLF